MEDQNHADQVGNLQHREKRIWINLQLAKKTPECLVYIVTHELVHFLERSHNKQFCKHMDAFFPDWQVVKSELNQQVLDYMSE